VRLFLIKYRWLVLGYITFELLITAVTYKHYLPAANALLAHYWPH